MTVDEMRADIAMRSKRGISFILASILLWAGISIIWMLPIPNTLTSNFLTFCLTAPLVPLAYAISRVIKAEFSSSGNPLNNLGILFSIGQMLYLPIAIWAFSGAPDKMVMIVAIIFGAHLLPFSWLFKSRAYLVAAVFIPILITGVGWNLAETRTFVIPLVMLTIELLFAALLCMENRRSGY